MAEETWEFDISEMTLGDMILLEEAGEGGHSVRELRDLLSRLTTNRTVEEITALTYVGLQEICNALGEALKRETQPPKEVDTA